MEAAAPSVLGPCSPGSILHFGCWFQSSPGSQAGDLGRPASCGQGAGLVLVRVGGPALTRA